MNYYLSVSGDVMGVNISVYGADNSSDEYQAALKLKDILQRDLPTSANGEIVLFASATLFGQSVKDVDLMMIGSLDNYCANVGFYVEDGKYEFEKVYIRSFCTVIEIKRHDISSISRNGTDLYVMYGKQKHCVTLQSNLQKVSAFNFFKKTLSYSPFITNIIWFTQATTKDIQGLLRSDKNPLPSNVLGADFSCDNLMQLLVWQKKPAKKGNRYIFESQESLCTVEDIRKPLTLFSTTKTQMGELTRKKIEMITNKKFQESSLIKEDGKVAIYRGRAGTGKTIGLIQTAIALVDEQQARVLMLTYNRALVSDIQRLFAFAELPDMFDEKCVSVNTMQSYFFHLSNYLIYNGKMTGDKFLAHYIAVLNELNEFLSDEDAISLARDAMLNNEYLNWDYLLIDEAQDWTAAERDIVLKLFDSGRIIIADGGSQFVRGQESCDWSVVRERNNIKLKYCLRQKENIVTFLNSFSEKMETASGKILSSGKMPGGKILIIDDQHLFEFHKKEMELLINAGNTAYDMLYLVPHKLVKKNLNTSHFSLTESFEANGITIWDGTNSLNRSDYSISTTDIRVLQYDSSRGLEGWTVVCMDFDVFIEEKDEEYISGAVNSLILESPEERKKKHLYNWMMIPLTRAIDTLVITLENPNSKIGKILKSVADEHPDYVTWFC